MIVHVIADSTYANDFICFMNRNYNMKEHFVYVTVTRGDGGSYIDYQAKKCSWVYLTQGNIKDFDKKVKRADKIIIHGLFDLLIIYWLFLHPKQLHKTIISIWGAELYDHRNILLKKVTFREKAIDYLKGYIFRRTLFFLNDMPDDYELLKEWYHVHSKSIQILYPSSVDKTFLQNVKNAPKLVHCTKRIIIGNSATSTNCHEEVFAFLEKYTKEDIEIYCPLSYGDEEYARITIERGNNIFGERFHGITNFMSPIEYAKLLATMDVAIFNNNRNQAMANIAILAFLGCKMYLRDDTTMWNQYVIRGKCAFHPFIDIKKETFDEFTTNYSEEQKINKKYFEQQWDDEYLRTMWDKVFITD